MILARMTPRILTWRALLGATLAIAVTGEPFAALAAPKSDAARTSAASNPAARNPPPKNDPANGAVRNGAKKGAAKRETAKNGTANGAPAKKAATRNRAGKNPLKIPNSQIEPVAWHQIAGWTDDDHAAAFATFLVSCRAILRSTPKSRAQRPPAYTALHEICKRAVAAIPLDAAGARAFFEQNFRAVRLSPLGESMAFFTGYYEPIVDGARLPSDEYIVPLYRRPNNLITQRLRRAGKKAKVGTRVVKKTAPFYERAQIEDGAIAGRELEICYLKSPIDAFFAEIQGSTRVRLEDGSMLRLNYAAGNGHPYTAVGKFLIERNIVSKEEMSMQKIREYMEANPEEGRKLRRENKSYVFFREAELSEFDEAIGAQGVSLTDGRSIAVDRRLHTYGMPFFVDAVLPIQSEKPDTNFRRLMIAQDTGGAIVGPARADIYLGAGEEAARAAGRFKHFGNFVMLVPNELDPGNVARGVPLPLPKPKIPGEEVAKVVDGGERRGEEASAGKATRVAGTVDALPEKKTRTNGRNAVSVPLPKARPAKRTP